MQAHPYANLSGLYAVKHIMEVSHFQMSRPSVLSSSESPKVCCSCHYMEEGPPPFLCEDSQKCGKAKRGEKSINLIFFLV